MMAYIKMNTGSCSRHSTNISSSRHRLMDSSKAFGTRGRRPPFGHINPETFGWSECRLSLLLGASECVLAEHHTRRESGCICVNTECDTARIEDTHSTNDSTNLLAWLTGGHSYHQGSFYARLILRRYR